MSKTVFILNQSRRLHLIGGVRILPTEAKEMPAEIVDTAAFKFCQEKGELAIVEAAREPITEEEAARKENDRRKKEGVQINNGAPTKSARSGRARNTGEGQGEA